MGIFITFIATATLFVLVIATWKAGPQETAPSGAPKVETPSVPGSMTAGNTEAQLNEWLAQGDARRDANAGSGFGGGLAVLTMAPERTAVPKAANDATAQGNAMPTDAASAGTPGGVGGAGRVSDTNVQTVGIDEPDIIKTDGSRIFFSPEISYGQPIAKSGVPAPLMAESGAAAGSGTNETAPAPAVDVAGDMRMIAPGEPYPGYEPPTTKVIDAFPPEKLALTEGLDRTGELLLHGDVLMVFAYDGVYAYDVSGDTAKATWSYLYGDKHELVTARLRGDEVILVQRAGIDRTRPCPIVPLRGAATVSVPCGDVWHPVAPTPADVAYTVTSLKADTGAKVASAAFLGDWSSTATYVSADDVYVSWQIPTDTLHALMAFIAETDTFPADLKASVAKLDGIDISDRAKTVELQVLVERWMRGLDSDAQLLVNTELSNRADAFVERRQRDYVRTGIVRVSADGLKVVADGTVPGVLLNQFSMDAYDGHLRVATTTGGRGIFGWQFGFGGTDKSVNDVYVLDGDLHETGSVQDLGRGERVYSARFVGDKGYVVTFRQTDPFYVLDLSDPNAPRMAGQLKIPGFSSYLHPIDGHTVLGVGKEDGRVKVSLFDVGDPSNPKETAKYLLDEGWSDVLSTHHAFLLDDKHGVFFLPGGKGGYVFSYGDGDLALVKAVSGFNARRAIYLDDYLYVVGNDSIVALDENTWERVGELDLMKKR